VSGRTAAARLGLLVPCHDEGAVIERKLANLAGCAWPSGRHELLVVDDGSRDETAERARAACARWFPAAGSVRARVIANEARPGKSGAIASGLAALRAQDGRPGVDLVVLTDADVVLRRDALIELERAFAADERLGLACGAQEFVADLASDGRAASASGTEPVPRAGWYDRLTARVRSLESRAGRLFSVHGQLAAWRARLELAPRFGIAADDLDLMVQARARGARVRLVPRAVFLECKLDARSGWEQQGLRRARAFVQLVRDPGHARPLGSTWLDRVQWSCYRHVPLAAPWLAATALLLAPLVLAFAGSHRAAVALLVLELALLASPPGRRLAHLLTVIARAQRAESRTGSSDRWEMQRT